MSCFVNHQSCCEKTINNIIDECKVQLKTATILFYCQIVPESDFLSKLHKNLSPARVLIVSKEFSRSWDEALEQLKTYKKRVIGREIDLPIILHDIENFLKNEKSNYDTVKRNFKVKLSMIDEDRQQEIIEKIEELDGLFASYLEDLENKKTMIMEAEDYMPLILDEINNNIDWYYKQKRLAEQKFKEKIDCMVGDLINSSIVKTYKAGKNITLSILKLEEKLRQKRIELGGVDSNDLEVSEEISKLQQERSSLDYQAATLVELENTFQKLIKEQNEIFETMKRLEEEFDKQVQEIMSDDCLSEDEKELKIKELRCKHEAEINELNEREELIHGKIEMIRHEILARHDGFDIELLEKIGMGKDKGSCEALKSTDPNFKLYHFDEYGRYFINENGLKIYKSDCSSKAYVLDENGNLLEIRMEGSQVLFVSDSDYLKFHIGEPLKKAMAQVFLYQPVDPITYLANYLIKYRKNVVAEEERKRDLDDLLLREDRTC